MPVCRRSIPIEPQNIESMLTFPKGGTHPPELKEQTAGLSIEVMPVPDELELILGQHIGHVPSPPQGMPSHLQRSPEEPRHQAIQHLQEVRILRL